MSMLKNLSMNNDMYFLVVLFIKEPPNFIWKGPKSIAKKVKLGRCNPFQDAVKL